MTRLGLAFLEQILAEYLARVGEGDGTAVDPVAALATFIRGYDGSVLGEEHFVAPVSRSTSERPCCELFRVRDVLHLVKMVSGFGPWSKGWRELRRVADAARWRGS